MISDPPYNVPIHGHVCGTGTIKHREFPMASGEMSKAEFTSFLQAYLQSSAARVCPGALLFVFMDWRHTAELLMAASALALTPKAQCVWIKSNAGLGSLYRSQHELVFVFKAGRGRHVNNIELGRHGRHRSTVWSYPSVNSLDPERRGELALHPTVKPAELVADVLRDCSHRGQAVLDPFLGSGTTLIAAEMTGRRGFGLELDPRYVDVALRRWEAFTGQAARHRASGLDFKALAAERGRAAAAL